MGAPSIILTVIDKVVDPRAAMIGFAVVLSAGAALAVRASLARPVVGVLAETARNEAAGRAS
jgi:hypothetical protein